jgi:hypothetical protein
MLLYCTVSTLKPIAVDQTGIKMGLAQYVRDEEVGKTIRDEKGRRDLLTWNGRHDFSNLSLQASVSRGSAHEVLKEGYCKSKRTVEGADAGTDASLSTARLLGPQEKQGKNWTYL